MNRRAGSKARIRESSVVTPRPVLIVGGAPLMAVDAVRFLSVHATGATAVALARGLRRRRIEVTLLLGELVAVAVPRGLTTARFRARAQLESEIRRWLRTHRDGVVVMSAAVNDYTVVGCDVVAGSQVSAVATGAKLSSGHDEVRIRLQPASKIIDQLPAWGLRGPMVGFKYEASATVIASAQALAQRVNAAVVVANSLDGKTQALVSAVGVDRYGDRGALVRALIIRINHLARS